MEKPVNSRALLYSSLYAQNSADREKYDSLLNIAYSCPKGAETMERFGAMQAKEAYGSRYKVMYEQLYNVNGSCDPERKSIYLHSYFTQPKLAQIFVHEVTHALQFEGVEKDISKLNTVDMIKMHRAVEADASAHEAAFVYEMKDKYPAVYEDHLKTPMMQAYATEMDKGGDERKAMADAFKAWYSYETYQKSYGEQEIGKIKVASAATEKDPTAGYFQETFSDEEILSMCQFKGKPYVDASVFNSKEALAVSKEMKQDISKEMKKLARITGANPDKTAASLIVRGEAVSNTAKPVEKKAITAVAAKLSKGR